MVPDLEMCQVSRSTWIHCHHASIIPVLKIECSVHLILKFGQVMDVTWSADNILEVYKTLFVNPYVHHLDFLLFCYLVTWLCLVLPRFGSVFFRFFVGFFVIKNVVIDMTTQIMMGNIAPLHIFHIKKDLFKSMQPILRYSKNNKQLFCMVPKWLTSYLVIYVINQWSTAFGPISNPSVFEVLYLVKYFGGFKYFISHDIKNRFKNVVTLVGIHLQS